MRKLDVGPTIDAASWRSVDRGVYARGPKGVYCCRWMVMVFSARVADNGIRESKSVKITLLREQRRPQTPWLICLEERTEESREDG
jgi:hypothetical protein